VFEGSLGSLGRRGVRAPWFGDAEFFNMAGESPRFARLSSPEALDLPFHQHADAGGNDEK
jgi:hypothetical protein